VWYVSVLEGEDSAVVIVTDPEPLTSETEKPDGLTAWSFGMENLIIALGGIGLVVVKPTFKAIGLPTKVSDLTEVTLSTSLGVSAVTVKEEDSSISSLPEKVLIRKGEVVAPD